MKNLVVTVLLALAVAACSSSQTKDSDVASNEDGQKTKRVCETVRTNETGARMKRVCKTVVVSEDEDA